MSSKIESLTLAQEAQLEVYRDKWLAIGLSTERVDPVRARAAVDGGGIRHGKVVAAAGVKVNHRNGIKNHVTSLRRFRLFPCPLTNNNRKLYE